MKLDIKLGAHMSISGGMDQAIIRGKKIGCNSIQVFTKNASRWKTKEFSKEDIQKFHDQVSKSRISPVIAHDSYLINLASPNAELEEKSCNALIEELKRCEALNIPYLVIHPGSHLNSGEKEGIKKISENLNKAIKATTNTPCRILLETTSGQGTSIGYKFEHLAEIIKQIKKKQRIGVCLDTCHIFTAGYDIRTKKAYENTMTEFNSIIGIKNLYAIHLNDSKKEFASRVDRHEHIGKGHIGLDGFKFLLNDQRLTHMPMILETPGSKEMIEDIKNLKTLRSLIK